MSFTQPRQPQRKTSVPLAPMLDVLFLLLIFFVTTSSFRDEEQQVDIQLPSTQSGAPAEARRYEVIVNILQDGSMTIANVPVKRADLFGKLKVLSKDWPGMHVIIRGDKDVKFDSIIAAMDTARAAGVKHIFFATVKQAQDVR
ncbi:MAG: hypothetical protein GC159_12670 [Phycisphaera sp.]|nr:hypothetical protein [Phycisphaera sp.]